VSSLAKLVRTWLLPHLQPPRNATFAGGHRDHVTAALELNNTALEAEDDEC
jgi:hypothetical protein